MKTFGKLFSKGNGRRNGAKHLDSRTIQQFWTNDEALIDFKSDLYQKAALQTMPYTEFCVKLLSLPEYQNLVERAISILNIMSSLYLCGSGYSSLYKWKKSGKKLEKNF